MKIGTRFEFGSPWPWMVYNEDFLKWYRILVQNSVFTATDKNLIFLHSAISQCLVDARLSSGH